jgi:hypothetical protein
MFRNSEAKFIELFDVRANSPIASYQRFGGICSLCISKAEVGMITTITDYHCNDIWLRGAFGRLKIMGEC